MRPVDDEGWPSGVTAALCAVPVALLVALAWHRRWITDDAFINLRVVDNIGDGNGPVYNAGERVEAYTSPLWLAVVWLFGAALWFAELEWIAVVLGILLSAVGLAAAARGALLVWRRVGPVPLALPLGLLVYVALPPAWDFATSGLENGLALAWLGGSMWAVAATLDAERPRAAAVAALAGLGPLVRPDLALFSVAFLVALFLSVRPDGWLARARLAGWALLLPAAYQVFRMGYFAALVPNTALAKEAGVPAWSRGWDYLRDLADPYLLALPVLALGAYAAVVARGAVGPARRALAVAACPAAAGLLHAIYVVRVGGDFMHGRMLLPSLFGLLLPVAVVPVRRTWAFAVALVVVPWAIVCAAALRAPYAGSAEWGPPPARIADERAVYVEIAGDSHPVTISDHRRNEFARYGRALRRAADAGRRVLLLERSPPDTRGGLRANGPPAESAPAGVVAASHPAIGLAGYAAGPDVYIVDQVGLGDSIAARTRLGTIVLPGGRTFPERWRAGHEKYLPAEWVAARFGPAGAVRFPGTELSPQGVIAARSALRCEQLARLATATRDGLSPGRFLSNVARSFSLTRLRYPSDPGAAVREVCG